MNIRYRSILSSILALLSVFFVSCGNPADTAEPPTYSKADIENLQVLAGEVTEFRDGMESRLQPAIEKRQWLEVDSFLHGPLGSLRPQMSYITRQLLPQYQEQAQPLTKDLFRHLEAIDVADETGNYRQAKENYQAALEDVNEFLQLIPQKEVDEGDSQTDQAAS